MSSLVAERLEIKHIDLDERPREEPYSYQRFLNLRKVLPPLIQNLDGFLIDIGGNTIFQRGADIEDRVAQVEWMKNEYGMTFVLLTATEEVLRSRNETSDEPIGDYGEIYEDWRSVTEPQWRQLVDDELVIDTTALSEERVSELVVSKLEQVKEKEPTVS